jgi:peptidoglycan/LPS O-acetylase OafA/YrhL
MAPKYERFVALDGLRGIAALSVMGLHWTTIVGWEGHEFRNIGLAVDFFFCLSGFVVAHAYDRRLRAGMGLWAFMKRRLTRLYPMILAGAILGLAAHLYVGNRPTSDALVDAVAAALMVPLGAVRHQPTFPTNDPMWSLFFELAACLGYGIAAKFLPARALPWITAALGVVLGVAVLSRGRVTTFGVYGLAGCFAAFFRAGYPFLLGVLLNRAGTHKALPPMSPAIAAAALLAVLFFPDIWLGPYQALAVLAALPAILLIGAATPLGSRLTVAADRLGELSYPLYLVHFPTITIVHAIAGGRLSAPLDAALTMGCSICVAQAALIFYDKPVRSWLGTRRLQVEAV